VEARDHSGEHEATCCSLRAGSCRSRRRRRSPGLKRSPPGRSTQARATRRRVTASAWPCSAPAAARSRPPRDSAHRRQPRCLPALARMDDSEDGLPYRDRTKRLFSASRHPALDRAAIFGSWSWGARDDSQRWLLPLFRTIGTGRSRGDQGPRTPSEGDPTDEIAASGSCPLTRGIRAHEAQRRAHHRPHHRGHERRYPNGRRAPSGRQT